MKTNRKLISKSKQTQQKAKPTKWRVRVQNIDSGGGCEDYLNLPFDCESLGSDFTVTFRTRKAAVEFSDYVNEEYKDSNPVITVKPVVPRTIKAKEHAVKEHVRRVASNLGQSKLVLVKGHRRNG